MMQAFAPSLFVSLILLPDNGIVLGAPVHYASAAGQASCAYDRLFVMSNGAFAMTISRELAVTGPLVVTIACLVLMLTSRKVLYPWAVSVFTLILPVVLLVSNVTCSSFPISNLREIFSYLTS